MSVWELPWVGIRPHFTSTVSQFKGKCVLNFNSCPNLQTLWYRNIPVAYMMPCVLTATSQSAWQRQVEYHLYSNRILNWIRDYNWNWIMWTVLHCFTMTSQLLFTLCKTGAYNVVALYCEQCLSTLWLCTVRNVCLLCGSVAIDSSFVAVALCYNVCCVGKERYLPSWSRWRQGRLGLSDWSITREQTTDTRQWSGVV